MGGLFFGGGVSKTGAGSGEGESTGRFLFFAGEGFLELFGFTHFFFSEGRGVGGSIGCL